MISTINQSNSAGAPPQRHSGGSALSRSSGSDQSSSLSSSNNSNSVGVGNRNVAFTGDGAQMVTSDHQQASPTPPLQRRLAKSFSVAPSQSHSKGSYQTFHFSLIGNSDLRSHANFRHTVEYTKFTFISQLHPNISSYCAVLTNRTRSAS